MNIPDRKPTITHRGLKAYRFEDGKLRIPILVLSDAETWEPIENGATILWAPIEDYDEAEATGKFDHWPNPIVTSSVLAGPNYFE